MGNEVLEVAERFFSSRFERWPDGCFELLAEDVVINPSNGHIYVGHEGFAAWYQEQIKDNAHRHYEPVASELIRESWALMRGAMTDTRRDGEQQVLPGCWLVHVRKGLIAAILYYRTEGDARAALSV